MCAPLFDLENDLHHDRRADWQTLNTVHHPHMAVLGAEELNEQIRCTVSDGGMLGKLLRRGQNNAQLYQLLYAIQVAKMLLRAGLRRKCPPA